MRSIALLVISQFIACRGCVDTGANCAQLSSQCSTPQWEELLTRYCTATCGKCAESQMSPCVDRASNCLLLSHRCSDPVYSSIMSVNCAATCEKCRGSPTRGCTDTAYNCPLLVHRCDDDRYRSIMSRYCRKTCALCTSDNSMVSNEIFARPEKNEELTPLTTSPPVLFPYGYSIDGTGKRRGEMDKLMEGANGIVRFILALRKRFTRTQFLLREETI